ncbi:MAG TPA: hypothetical protein VL262_02110 [Vicinamibacterales bacterium]|jgi:hypothetical protein|nr:hypothetical protein [Vicinamibacterales bacterium]
MKHLSAAEFVDDVEGRLPDRRRTHLDACRACAEQARIVRDTLREAHETDVPEPSPLFWDHFSVRVSDAVRNSRPDPVAWWRHPAWAIACSVAVVAAVLIGGRDARVSPPVVVAPSAIGPAAPAPTDDPAWNLLTEVASSVEQQDPQAAPLTVRPSEVDRAVVNLSAAERRELRRLLEDEMKRPGN